MKNFVILCIKTPLLYFAFTVFAASEDIPTLRYKIDIAPDGQVVVNKLDEVSSQGLTEIMDSKKLYETKNAWVVLNSDNEFVEAVPSGTTEILSRLGQGDTLQVVPANRIKTIGFFSDETIEEMELKIKMQVRSAATAFKEEACNTMKDWDSVKFSFEIGASAFVVAKITAEGTFTPSKAC